MNKVVVLICAFAVALVSAAFSQGQDENNVRGAFLTSRPKAEEGRKTSATPARSRRRPKAAVANTVTPPEPTAKATQPAGTGEPPTTTEQPPRTRAQRIGLGLTLFMRDSNGMSVRVDPAHEFREGDRIRVLLETNADGYLYIFNTTNDGPPVMIYPDPDLDEGGNYVQSHVPFEIPSSLAAEERLRWLEFDKHAGRERVYFVFARQPLPAIPIEEALINYCRENTQACPVRPATDLWAQIRKDADLPTQTAKAENYGNVETPGERQATTRGIGLSKQDPEPSLVIMTVSADRDTLVTAIDLTHK